MSWGSPQSGWQFGWGGSNPIVRRVGTTREFQTIQDAIDDVDDGWSGDTFTGPQFIVVDPETYSETPIVPSTIQPTSSYPLVIQAAKDQPIIDAGGASTAVTIQADNVHFFDFRVRDATDIGVDVQSGFVWVNAILIEAVTVGIQASGNDGQFTNNQIHAYEKGVDLQSGGSNLVDFNSIYIQGRGTTGGIGLNIIESDAEVRMNVVLARADRQDTWAISVEDSTLPSLTIDRNAYHTINAASKTAYVGRHPNGTPNHTTLSSWQTEIGQESNSVELDPDWQNVPIEGTVDSASVDGDETEVTDGAKVFSENELRSHIIEFLTGSLTGNQYVVRINEADTFVLQGLTTAPSPGDTYRIIWEDGTSLFNARPRFNSPLFDVLGVPISLTDNDIDQNVRDGVSPTLGCYEAKNVVPTVEQPLILEVLAGLQPALDQVFGGRGGALSRFVPGDKLPSDSSLNDEIVQAPVKSATESGGIVKVVMALGIDQLFPDQLLDGTVDFLDEIALGNSSGRILFLRSDQEIPLDPLTQVTTEITTRFEFVRV